MSRRSSAGPNRCPRVVDGLLDVVVLQLEANGLDLDEEQVLAIGQLDPKVTPRASNRAFRCDFCVLVVAEQLREGVLDECDGVGLVDISGLRRCENRLELAQASGKPLCDLLG